MNNGTLQRVPSIMSPSMADLTHRKPA